MRRRGREFWTEQVAELGRSGLSQARFARSRGLPVGTLRSWVYRLRAEEVGTEPTVRLLPVRNSVEGLEPVARETLTVEALLATGEQLRFAVGTDAVYVANLLAAVRRSC